MTKINILLVDDYPANLVALSAVLAEPAYNLIEASSGAEAIRITLEQEISLILLDVQMPGMDGYEVARQIRKIPGKKDVPIIFITAIYREDPAIRKGYEVGGQDYLGKPFDPEVLRAKVSIYSGLSLKIAELERQKRLLTESEARYRLIVEGAQEIIATMDFSGTVTSLNIAFERLTGRKCADWIGKSFVPLVADEDVPTVLAQFGESVSRDSTNLSQVRLRTIQDEFIPVEISVQPLGRDGNLLGTVGIIRDISSRQPA